MININKTNGWIKKAISLYDLQLKIKRLKAEEKESIQSLVTLSKNENTSGKNADGCFELKEITMPGIVKYKDIPELKDIDLDVYRGNEYSYWRLFKKY